MANAKFSQGTRDNMLSASVAVESAFDSGVLEIRDGTQPATANLAVTGTLLASIDVDANSFGAIADGVISLSGTWTEASSPAPGGTATWFRLKRSTDTNAVSTTEMRIDGDVTTTAVGTGDLTMATTVIATSDTVTVDTFTITVPA